MRARQGLGMGVIRHTLKNVETIGLKCACRNFIQSQINGSAAADFHNFASVLSKRAEEEGYFCNRKKQQLYVIICSKMRIGDVI